MTSSGDKLFAAASILGATAVSAGAFGAHYLNFTTDQRRANWQTATYYSLIHASLILASSSDPKLRKANLAWLVGSTLFSGSIYCLCQDVGPKMIFGPMTPLGGSTIIAGWLLAAASRF